MVSGHSAASRSRVKDSDRQHAGGPVRRDDSKARQGGLHWADPAECLLDLHEAHLDAHATQFRKARSGRGRLCHEASTPTSSRHALLSRRYPP